MAEPKLIPKDNITMSKKNEDGFHYVRDRYCDCESLYCFAFTGNGLEWKYCSNFRWGILRRKLCEK